MSDPSPSGLHLTMDMHGVSTLTDISVPDLYRFLEDLPKAVAMQPVSTPQFVFLDNEPPALPGISASIILAESHASFHTWPEHKYVSLDLYSCRQFDTETAVRFVTDFWQPSGRVNTQVLTRG